MWVNSEDPDETTVELQWLEQARDHENWFQPKVVPASKGKIQNL